MRKISRVRFVEMQYPQIDDRIARIYQGKFVFIPCVEDIQPNELLPIIKRHIEARGGEYKLTKAIVNDRCGFWIHCIRREPGRAVPAPRKNACVK